jgi:hypothetical protein
MIGCKPITKPIYKPPNGGSNFNGNGSNFGINRKHPGLLILRLFDCAQSKPAQDPKENS